MKDRILPVQAGECRAHAVSVGMFLRQLINVAVDGLQQRSERWIVLMKVPGLNIPHYEINRLLASQVAKPVTAYAVSNGEEASSLVEPISVLVGSPQIASMRHSGSLHGSL